MTDEEELFTTAEVVELTGFTRAAIENWVRRGYLTPVPGRKRGRSKLFRLDDVFTCEKTRKRKHRRKNSGDTL
ncbi:phage terminase Nu1 subunit (DNA packaging protein) [Thermocatellispora tengchongensis]|uniref:Phage terminase Nu1 subunit (DNA packaging protein) n=1 Tax=Thermocatellispora tengchongensis TaxID=1073253 RepID=A0A840NWG6_9ACTN|nr:helix-turn-helix domain-containing protein [Thermocatellispora tengchongensis]MBB5130526.1 phage terminase Nu1 subunit (DNA packaging protein) [Thermocatellispora tengchongensis]